jgi:glycogen(starch) synthase
VLVCSGYMKWEVQRLLDLPAQRVEVIPNGVDRRAWKAPRRAIAAARKRHAGAGPLIGYAGRLVYEKGVQHLVGAVPQLRREFPGLRVMVIGDGPYRDELQTQARGLHIGDDTLRFTGFLGATVLPALLGAMDTTVVPSLYEPFGMVALEAAAAGAPLAVADTGGLPEIVETGVTGVTFPSHEADGLATAVGRLLDDGVFARRVADRAQIMLRERFTWSGIARRTATAYGTAVRDAPRHEIGLMESRLAGGQAEIVVPDGNLLGIER